MNLINRLFDGIDNEVKITEESFIMNEDVLNYNIYEKFNIAIFNFDNRDGDYFSPLFYQYLHLGIDAK